MDGIAVTYAPGLIGAVLVGVNFAKGAALALDVPLIPVHHIRGHIAANYLAYPELEPPFLCLVVSGGHTMLVDVRDYTDMEILGTTLDDAAGECFDKVARVLGMPYPGGAALDQEARAGQEGRYPLPRARGGENPLDMSFSGLKTAAINLIHNARAEGGASGWCQDLCADFSAAVSRHPGAPGHGGPGPHRLQEAGCGRRRRRQFPHPPGRPGGGQWAGRPGVHARPWPSAGTTPP